MKPKDEQAHPLYDRPAAQPPEKAKTGAKQRRPLRQQPLLTWALIAVCGGIYLAGFLSPMLELELFLRGAMIPQLVVGHGELYRLVSAMFLHASLGHVFFNMYALFIVGGALERVVGRPRFLLIYFLGGLTGSALSLALGGLDGASVGASGAVFALFVAHHVNIKMNSEFYVGAPGQLRHMAMLIVINLVIGFLPGSRIDNLAHIGGMLGGALLAWRFGPRFKFVALQHRLGLMRVAVDQNPLSKRLPELAIAIAALAIVIGLVVVLRGPQLL